MISGAAQMNQSQAQRSEEEAVFAAFLAVQPDFAGEPIEDWKLAASDPPDVICSTASGRAIGVELGEWLHEREMGAGKLREKIGQQLIEAIGEPQPLNTSSHFDMVILHPQERVRLKVGPDRLAFRQAVLDLIHAVDLRWPQERFWHGPQGCRIRDLAAWPPLGAYLKEVQFHPGQSKWGEGINWILPPAHAEWFDDQTMAEPLVRLIRDKLAKYQSRPMATPSDGLVLLAFLNQGLVYNSPIETPRRPVEHPVEDVRRLFANEHEPFQSAFLFLAPSPGERAFRLW